jgi:hypothetical protein
VAETWNLARIRGSPGQEIIPGASEGWEGQILARIAAEGLLRQFRAIALEMGLVSITSCEENVSQKKSPLFLAKFLRTPEKCVSVHPDATKAAERLSNGIGGWRTQTGFGMLGTSGAQLTV